MFFLEPFYQNNGWNGVLNATKVALMLCIMLVAIYQSLSLKDKNTTPQAA